MHVLGQVEAAHEKSISVFQEVCGKVVSVQSLWGGAAGAVWLKGCSGAGATTSGSEGFCAGQLLEGV